MQDGTIELQTSFNEMSDQQFGEIYDQLSDGERRDLAIKLFRLFAILMDGHTSLAEEMLDRAKAGTAVPTYLMVYLSRLLRDLTDASVPLKSITEVIRSKS